MGSRAVVVVCRDPSVALTRFGIESAAAGSIFTRTGRPFFSDAATESAFLERVRTGVGRAGLWGELSSDWLILDCELLPWSAKAEELLRRQYASVGAAATKALRAERAAIDATAGRGVDVGNLVDETNERVAMVDAFVTAYRQYCWDVNGIEGLALAPFQILAGEAEVYALRDHLWHLDILGRLCATDPTTFRTTRSLTVDVNDAASVERGSQWWEELTAAGGEGMVVKPLQVLHRGPKGLVQPGIKCRGRDYLRIIYGPEYTAARNLSRLRSRGLGLKRSLALREFALGLEALERFTAAEPLYRVHECVFGVLALESEAVDPRL